MDASIRAKIKPGEKPLGFTFETKVAEDVLAGLAPTISLGFNLKEKTAADGSADYDFLSYDLSFGGPIIDMSCNNNLKAITIANKTPYSGAVAELKEIKVGRFVLTPDLSALARNADGSYKGTGIIKVPVLGPMQQLQVAFENLKVNSVKQMIDGSIVTKADKDGLFKDPNIKGLLGQATSKLNTYANKAVTLPVILGDPKKDGYNFTFTGIEWKYDKASLSARLLVDMGNEKYAEFRAEGLNIVPGGIAGADIILSLVDTVSLQGTTLDYPIAFDGYNSEKKSGSYVLCDCDGFQNFNLSGKYSFDKKTTKNLANPGKAVTASFSVKTDEWAAFMAEVTAIDSFAIEGIDGFTFKPGKTTLDFSKKKSVKDAKFPKGYSADESWRGLYISSIDVSVPSSFTGGTPGSFNSKNLIVDASGVSSNLSGIRIVDQKSGDLGGWAFSIDSFEMNVIKNSLVDGEFKGGMVLPIMSQEKGEFMPYVSSFKQKEYKNDKGETKKDYDMDFSAVPTTVASSVLRSKITFDKKSTITVGRKDGNYSAPKVSLTGVLEVGIEVKEGELSPIAKKVFDNIKSSAKELGLSAKDIDDLIPGLQSKGIKFEDMVIDMSAPSGQSKFSVKDFAVEKTSIKFLGSKSPLEDVTYQVFNLDSLKLDATKLARLKKDSSRVVGLTFKSKLAEDFLGGLAPTVHFGLQLEEKPSEKEVTYMALQDDGTREKKKKTIKGRSFSFFDYSLNFEKPDVNLSCRSTSKKELVIGAPHQWEGGQLDSVKVGYFTVRLSNSGGFTNGKYTGKGIVDIPVLGPMRSVNVDLKDVAFDSKKQMVSGEVMTKGKSFQNTDTGLSGMLASAKAKLIAKSNKVSLPVVLSGDMKKDGYTILFEGLVFSPTKAEVSMKAILELGGGKYGTFTAKGLNLVPKGIDGVDARLSLEEVLDLKGTKFDIPLKINPYRKSVAAAGDDSSTQQSISGSYISCDCDGFRGFNLSGEYTFDKDYVNLVKVGQPVKAQFKVTSKTFGDFVGKLADVDTFAVADLPGFEFAISGVELDYSGKESIKGMTVPKGYASVDSAWHGLYAKDIYVKVPSSFTGGSPGAFNSKHMVIDSNGFSSNFLGTKIVDQKSGNLGGWAFSIDTFSMNVLKNNLVDGAFNGGIVLPIMSQDKGEFMPYKSSFKQKSFKNAKGETKKDYDMSFAAVPTTVNSSVLRSKITFDTKSSITVSRKDGNYEAPKVSLNGVLEIGIEAKEGELSPIAKSIFANIKSSAKDLGLSAKDIDDLIPGLQSKGIRFEELVIDMNAPTGQSKFSIKDFAVDKTSIKFLGSKSPLENVKYEVYVLDSMNLDASKLARLKKDSSKVVGLTFKSKLAEDFLGGLAPTVHFGLQLEEKPKSSVVNYYSLKDDGTREKKTKTVQGRDFSFFDYSLKFEKPDVNMACRETNKKSITLGAAKNWEAGQLDSVKIGHFSVKLSGNGSMVGGKYSGMGIADIPVLGPMRSVNVELKNVTFDDQKRMIDGDVTTKGKAFANTDTGLTGLLDNAKKKLISQANQALEFPVILGGDIEKDGYSFIFDGISFKANKAELSARVVVDLGNKQLGVFEGAGMSIVPKGISGVNVRMGLKSALDLSKTELGLPLTFRAFDTKDTLGSFVACDCDGFQGFNIGGQINFPEDKLQSVKGLKDSSKKKVSASFKMNTKKWGDFMGVVTMPDTVFIPGIEDMKIHFGTAEFDYSDFRNPENFKAPEGYGTKIDNKWVGLYIPQISLRLPDAITATSEGAVPLVTASHMIFDTSGFTGVFNAQNLISMDKANIGGLGFSLDSIRIDFLKNSMKESKFLGGIQLPMMTKEEFIPYEGEFTIATDKKTNKSFLDVAFNAQPKTVKIDMFKAEFSFDSTSVINIKRENGKFAKPLIDLSGSFKIDIPKTKDAFSADALANVKAIESYLGVSDILPTFSLDSIAFKHFKLDFNSKDNVFSIGDIKPRGTGVKFMTVDWKMDEIKFDDLKNLAADAKKKVDEVKKTTKSDALGKIKNLGLEFGFKYGPVGADFRIKIDEEKGKDDKVGYKFKGFAFDVDLPDAPKFTCDTTVIVKVPEDKSVAALEVGQMVTVGRYKMKVASASGTRGKGTIKIPFLGYTMNVSFTDLTVNKAGDMLNGSIVTDTDSSLIPESAASTGGKGVPFVATSDQLDSYLKKTQEFFTLPMSISKKLKDLAKVEMPAGLDVVVVGMNFNNKAASMNLVISVPSPISDQKPYVFGIRGMDVRPDGFDLGELKMFLAKDVQF